MGNRGANSTRRPPTRVLTALTPLLLLCALGTGCAEIRVTDSPRTADEQFLLNEASIRAVDGLSVAALRDYKLFVDPTYLSGSPLSIAGQPDTYSLSPNPPNVDQAFLLGEIRNKLLVSGARVVDDRKDADIVVEVRAAANGINKLQYLFGIPQIGGGANVTGSVPIIIPEIAFYKNLRQRGFTSVSLTARWSDTGELVQASGPSVGQTFRNDYWFFGIGPRTVGDIPPAQDAK